MPVAPPGCPVANVDDTAAGAAHADAMCGLIGALLAQPTLTDATATRALATIAHRGPDHTGWWFSSDRRSLLGHVRLSIIGLDNGDQPLANDDGDIRCVVNGELYGYRSIRAGLQAEGVGFTTESDSEIALRLYERWGAEFVHRLRGEFAVVIADQRRRCMVAVRDRFGIKPLFYTVRGGDVLVASEVKALLALGVPARWDRDSVLRRVSQRPPRRPHAVRRHLRGAARVHARGAQRTHRHPALLGHRLSDASCVGGRSSQRRRCGCGVSRGAG